MGSDRRSSSRKHVSEQFRAVVTSRRGLSGGERGQGVCCQWEAKGRCSRGDQCSFRHESNDRAQEPDHNAATLLSHPCHEVEVCRGKEVSEAKVTIVPYFDNRADTIWKVLARDRLVNSGILPSVNFYKTETGCKAGDKCAFPHHEVDEQPNQKANKGFFSHKRRDSDDKNAVAIVTKVPRLGCVSQDSDALVSYSGKQSRGNPMQKVLGSIRKARFTQSTVRQASIREKKGMKFEERSHEEAERQQRCAWNLAKNIFKLKEKDQATFYLPAEEWLLPAASTKELEERELVVDSRACMHMVSERDLDSAELQTMRTSRSPTTVMTANGEVQTREEGTVYIEESDVFVTVMLLEETPAVLSLGKFSEDHGYTYHWTSGQKPHLTQNGQDN